MRYRSGAVNMSSEVGVTMRMAPWVLGLPPRPKRSCRVARFPSSLSLLKSLTGYTIHMAFSIVLGNTSISTEDNLIAVLGEEKGKGKMPVFAPDLRRLGGACEAGTRAARCVPPHG